MKMTRCYPQTNAGRHLDLLQAGLPMLDRVFSSTQDPETNTGRVPRTNITEASEAFTLTLEMPGDSKKDVEISIDSEQLVVKGGKSEATEKTEGKEALRREFRSARFERTFTLGKGIDTEKIKASMEHGVLTVTLPRAADKIGRRVDVA